MIILRRRVFCRPEVITHFFKLFFGIKSIICKSILYQSLGILPVAFFSFALPVGSVRSAVHRAFIGLHTAPTQAIKDVLLSAFYKTGLVGIFNTYNKIA